MVHIIYWIGVAIITAIYVISARKLVKHSYQKGMKNGTSDAVKWFTLALVASGFQGKQLTALLNTIAGHLNEFKEEQEQSDNKEKGGVNS